MSMNKCERELETALAENSVLWSSMKHIASMTEPTYCFNNAVGIARQAVELKGSVSGKCDD